MDVDWLKILRPHETRVRPEELERFESKLGSKLPQDYRDFLLKLNGGEIVVEHEIHLAELSAELGVSYLFPLTASRPSLGLVRAREIQVLNQLCLRQALPIGDDGGTGDYFLILEGEKRGAVFFIWLDDRPTLSEDEWESPEVRMPEDMIQVSPSFDALGQLILDSRLVP